MTEERFSLRVQIGEYEIELSGNREEVLSTLNELPSIVEKISRSFNLSERGVHRVTEIERQDDEASADEASEAVPTIPRPAGPSDAITKLLSTEWGRKPRVWQEINDALTINAIYYSKGSITGTLTNLTKKGKLRRIKTEKGFGYILS
ncbi:MAG: hypothetical protein JSW01_00625 [Candidatus Bathyarchaeota archaeon]|nr:MAG: hypothetical protein JSW01_00625 [Candidatus Bathyarchaeota archaeon]